MICVLAPRLHRQRRRHAAAELRRIAPYPPAGIAGIGRRQIAAAILHRRHVVIVVERLREASGYPGPLHEGAVGAVDQIGHLQAGVAGAEPGGDIGAGHAVFGLVADVDGDVAARPHRLVAGGAAVGVGVERPPRHVAVAAPRRFAADPAADLDAQIGARHVVEAGAIEAADFDILDRLGLYREIGGLARSHCNQTGCGAEQQALRPRHREHCAPCILFALLGLRRAFLHSGDCSILAQLA